MKNRNQQGQQQQQQKDSQQSQRSDRSDIDTTRSSGTGGQQDSDVDSDTSMRNR